MSEYRLQKLMRGCFLVHDRSGFIGALGGHKGAWTAYPADGTPAGWHEPFSEMFPTQDAACLALATQAEGRNL